MTKYIIITALLFPLFAGATTDCQTLLDRVTAGYNQVCGDAVADINKDKVIDISDLGDVLANFTNPTWCDTALANTSDPCYVPAPTVYVPANNGGGGCGPECRADWINGGSFRAEIQSAINRIQYLIEQLIKQM